MYTRSFGPTGEQVAVVGQGTWRIMDTTQAAEAIRVGLDLGMTHIDTAELYEHQSRSETMLGQVLQGRRDEVYLASKVLPQNGSHMGVRQALLASLSRLGTDRVDLYYLHWPGPHPLAETLAAMAELRDEGLLRHIGVSNFGIDDLEQAKAILGPGVLAADQMPYHLEDRRVEAEVVPWCKKNNVALVAYSPFGAGRLPDGPAWQKLADVASAEGRSVHQTILAFLARDASVFVIPKAEKVAHVRDNAGGDAPLSKEALERIDALFPLAPHVHS